MPSWVRAAQDLPPYVPLQFPAGSTVVDKTLAQTAGIFRGVSRAAGRTVDLPHACRGPRFSENTLASSEARDRRELRVASSCPGAVLICVLYRRPRLDSRHHVR